MTSITFCYVFDSLTFVHRISMFDFVVDKTISEPNITFVSEDPFLQYVRFSQYYQILID